MVIKSYSSDTGKLGDMLGFSSRSFSTWKNDIKGSIEEVDGVWKKFGAGLKTDFVIPKTPFEELGVEDFKTQLHQFNKETKGGTQSVKEFF